MYLRYNPTPTIYTLTFLAVVGLTASAAAVLPWRNFTLSLLAFVAGACQGFGMLTVSWFGFVLLGLMALAVLSIFRTMAKRPEPGSATLALVGGGLGGFAFDVELYQLVATAAPV